jgi:hypothetical protein
MTNSQTADQSTVKPLPDGTTPLWLLALSFISKKGLTNHVYNTAKRPRRMSIHGLAAMTGLDPLVILDEIEKAGPFTKSKHYAAGPGPGGTWGRVAGYWCPDVDCTVMYLTEYGVDGTNIMVDTRRPDFIETAKGDLKKYPFPKVQGFNGFGEAGTYASPTPFKPSDKAHAEELRDFLIANGATPTAKKVA